MSNNPFSTIKDFMQGNEKMRKTMEIFEKTQKKYEESISICSNKKSKIKGSNSTSIKGSYNVYISGTGRGY